MRGQKFINSLANQWSTALVSVAVDIFITWFLLHTCQPWQRLIFHVICQGISIVHFTSTFNQCPTWEWSFSAWVPADFSQISNLIGIFRIEIHVLSCHPENTIPAAHLKSCKVSRPPFGRRIIILCELFTWNNDLDYYILAKPLSYPFVCKWFDSLVVLRPQLPQYFVFGLIKI